MATKHSPFRLMDLPPEIRLRVLEFSPLVIRPLPNLLCDSLPIDDGECFVRTAPGKCCGRCPGSHCTCPSPTCRCYAFGSALFYTCRQLSLEAREACFSNNRLQFMGNPRLNLEKMLSRQPRPLLQLVREVEYCFSEVELAGFDPAEEEVSSELPPEWAEFVRFISNNLNVSNLNLSVDAGAAYDAWVTTSMPQKNLLFLRGVYDAIVQPLRELKGLKNLFIYWPVFPDLETEAERRVMGEGYDAYQHGKAPLKERNPFHPRGTLFEGLHLGYMGSFGELETETG